MCVTRKTVRNILNALRILASLLFRPKPGTIPKSIPRSIHCAIVPASDVMGDAVSRHKLLRPTDRQRRIGNRRNKNNHGIINPSDSVHQSFHWPMHWTDT
jgi:hypothetical protein